MKKTPLYDTHMELGARMVDFGGWMMPVQYSSIIEEHNAVRESAGVFDVSHMGEIRIEGHGTDEFVNYLLTNDISQLEAGKVMYSPMCYPNGGCVDDVLVYHVNHDHFFLVVNASNIEKDFEWIKEKASVFGVDVQDLSDKYGQIAVQGPKSQEILNSMTDYNLEDIGFFEFAYEITIGGVKTLVSRTGYTGEDGFEIYMHAEDVPVLFKKVLEAGGDSILPCGLGARDTLRFESCLPLYGHELSAEITPLQAGLKIFVKFTDSDFIGKAALMKESAEGPEKRIAGFEMVDRGIPRYGYMVTNEEGENIGFVTSGSMCPSLSKNMGLALIDKAYAKRGKDIYVGIRNKKAKALTVKKPFYNKKYKKQED